MSIYKRVLVFTYWGLNDGLVSSTMMPYLRMISDEIGTDGKIIFVTLDVKPPDRSVLAPYPNIEHRSFKYHRFGSKGILMVLRLLWSMWQIIRKERIDVIHTWCTPAGAVGHLLSRITGLPQILDSHEPHAESMVENGSWRKGGSAYQLLFALEKAQTRHARHIIAANAGMRGYAREKYGCDRPMHVRPACVDLKVFSREKARSPELVRSFGLEGKKVVVYAGKFGGIYWDKEFFELMAAAFRKWRDALRVLLFTNHDPQEIRMWVDQYDLPQEIFIIKFVPHDHIAEHIGLGDVAITPVRPVPSKRFCTPVKDGEYWAMGLPVIITPDISDDSDIIEKYAIGSVVRGTTPEDMDRAIEEIDTLLDSTSHDRLHARIRSVAEKYRNFADAARIYHLIYQGKDPLLNAASAGQAERPDP